MRRIVIAGLLAAGAALAGAASAEPQPLAGGNYLGGYERGTVKLKVSDDGRWLERFQVIGPRAKCVPGGLRGAVLARFRSRATDLARRDLRTCQSPAPSLPQHGAGDH
jgi:hypothetical protein